MNNQADVPTLAKRCYEKLQQINNGNFILLLSEYTTAIKAKMLSAKETPAATAVELYNKAESPLAKAWVLAAAYHLTTPTA